MLVLFLTLKLFSLTISEHDPKAIILGHFLIFFGRTPSRISVTVATVQVPADQKYFKIVYYASVLNVTKFRPSASYFF